jgi:hypothetical protein
VAGATGFLATGLGGGMGTPLIPTNSPIGRPAANSAAASAWGITVLLPLGTTPDAAVAAAAAAAAATGSNSSFFFFFGAALAFSLGSFGGAFFFLTGRAWGP